MAGDETAFLERQVLDSRIHALRNKPHREGKQLIYRIKIMAERSWRGFPHQLQLYAVATDSQESTEQRYRVLIRHVYKFIYLSRAKEITFAIKFLGS